MKIPSAPTVPAVSQERLTPETPLASHRGLDRAKWFVVEHFEQILVLLLVFSLLAIHWVIDDKFAFLNFYYLPIILAGFFLGRRTAVLSAVLIVALVLFYQQFEGLAEAPGFHLLALLTLAPWAGFLILTAYVVGRLSDQRQERLSDLKNAYLATLELLTLHLETTEKQQEGHSQRVAALALRLGEVVGLRGDDVENLRVAALLHEVGSREPRLLRLLSQSSGASGDLPVARAMRAASDLINEYSHYFEVVGDEWPIDQLPLSGGVKVLAVADAYETLQMPTPHRPAFAPWSAIEEIEKGAGKTFARDVVKALRHVSTAVEAEHEAKVRVLRALES